MTIAESDPPSPTRASMIASRLVGHGMWRVDRVNGLMTWWDTRSRESGPLVLDRDDQAVLATLTHPDDRRSLEQAHARAWSEGSAFALTLRLRRGDGSWRMLSCQVQPQLGADGAVVSLAGVVMDITEAEIGQILSELGTDIITQTDRSGVLVYVSPSVRQVTGFAPEELIGRTIRDLLGPETTERLDAEIARRIADPDSPARPVEYRTARKDGGVAWLESRVIPVFDPASGELMGVTDVVRDVTERKRGEALYEQAVVRLGAVMEASPSGIILVDEQRRIVSYNRRFAEMWDVPVEDLESGDLGRVLDRAANLFKDELAVRERFREAAGEPDAEQHDEIETTDGRWIYRYTVPVWTPAQGHIGRAWFFGDMTEQKQALDEAVRVSRYDHLTGLANRAALFEGLERAVQRAGRREQAYALFFLDLDNFKDVNDTLGHLVGDQLLVAISDRLRVAVGDMDLVARPGGDEFAVLVANVRTATEAAMLADRFIREVAAPCVIEGHQIYTSVSIGIELVGPDARDARTALSHADMAVYQAKSAGSGTYRFYTEAMNTRVRTRVLLGAQLREAIAGGQLFLVYQPEVDLAQGRVVGVEALVRWRHPERGVLGPDLFVPVAEQTGLIGALGRWVLKAATRQARQWVDMGRHDIRVGVNVSALQFKTPAALEADIASALGEAGLASDMLELELTESALMVASEAGDVLARLRHGGVRIAIDDFGTGYSSLDYLRRFPAERIKIAHTFVRDLGRRTGDAAIVKATIGLARELGMTTIAEGVETREQLALLRSWGCREGQGYLFDRPLSAEDATARLLSDGYGHAPGLSESFAA